MVVNNSWQVVLLVNDCTAFLSVLQSYNEQEKYICVLCCSLLLHTVIGEEKNLILIKIFQLIWRLFHTTEPSWTSAGCTKFAWCKTLHIKIHLHPKHGEGILLFNKWNSPLLIVYLKTVTLIILLACLFHLQKLLLAAVILSKLISFLKWVAKSCLCMQVVSSVSNL